MKIGDLIDTMANMEYGILIAVVLAAAMLLAVAAVRRDYKLNAISYLIAALLIVPLTFQMSRLVGACQMSGTASAVQDLVGIVSPTLGKYVASATSHDIGWFVFRRVMWSVLFTAVAGVAVAVTMDKRRRRQGVPAGIQTGRRYSSAANRRRR